MSKPMIRTSQKGRNKKSGAIFTALPGDVYTKLTVIEEGPKDSNYHRRVWCVCECGERKLVRVDALQANITRSCGKFSCLGENRLGFNTLNTRALKRLMDTYRSQAKKRKLSFNLDEELFLSLTQSPCFYCGIAKTNKLVFTCAAGTYSFSYNGIDRIDSMKGYEVDNVVSACALCNYSKRNLSKDSFYQWVSRVYNHKKEEILQCQKL